MIACIERMVGWVSDGGSDRSDGFLAGALFWLILAGFVGVPAALFVALIMNLFVWREERRAKKSKEPRP